MSITLKFPRKKAFEFITLFFPLPSIIADYHPRSIALSMPIKRSCENISFSFKWGIFFFEYLGRRIKGDNWFKFCGGKGGIFFSALWWWCVYDGGLSSSSPPSLAVGLVQAGGSSLWKERRKKKRRGGFFFSNGKGKRECFCFSISPAAGEGASSTAQQFPHTNEQQCAHAARNNPMCAAKKREKGFYSGIHCEDYYHCRRGEERKN